MKTSIRNTPKVQDDGIIENILNKTSGADKKFIEKAVEISEQIEFILEQKEMMQKDLANMLGKSEAEISKWLSGTHNFTLRTISLVESVLQSDIILTEVGLKLKAEAEGRDLNNWEKASFVVCQSGELNEYGGDFFLQEWNLQCPTSVTKKMEAVLTGCYGHPA